MDVRVRRASAVIVQQVPAQLNDWFLDWQRNVAAIAETFAGYRGTDLYPPARDGVDATVVVLHFEDEKSLALWLDSPIRAEWVQKLKARIGDFELRKLPGGFGPWFAEQNSHESAPAGWKMALTVLLGLYPTVVLLSLYPGTWISPLGLAASLLISNVCSVSLLQWVIMPVITKLFGPWLHAHPAKQPGLVAGGVALIAALLVGFMLLFRQVTG